MKRKISNIIASVIIISLLFSTVGIVEYSHHCACEGIETHSLVEDICCSSETESGSEDSCCNKAEEKKLPECCSSDHNEDISYVNSKNICICYSSTDYHSIDETIIITKVKSEIKNILIAEISYVSEISESNNKTENRILISDLIPQNHFGKSFLIKTHQLKIPSIS